MVILLEARGHFLSGKWKSCVVANLHILWAWDILIAKINLGNTTVLREQFACKTKVNISGTPVLLTVVALNPYALMIVFYDVSRMSLGYFYLYFSQNSGNQASIYLLVCLTIHKTFTHLLFGNDSYILILLVFKLIF